LAPVLASLNLGWCWGLHSLSGLAGLGAAGYIFFTFPDLKTSQDLGLLLAGGGGLLLALSVLYILIVSSGFRRLEATSTGVQLIAVLHLVFGLGVLIGLVMVIATVMVVGKVGVALLKLLLAHQQQQ
jgi:hypothetical protein